jgi:NAD(P)-dependent dehydrogenase (short-subunit alcohol dehydrogenase family)
VLVAGASGGIGRRSAQRSKDRFPDTTIRQARATACDLLTDIKRHDLDVDFDISDERRSPTRRSIWPGLSTGCLSRPAGCTATAAPEKTFKQLDADNLMHAYRVNAIGPALLIKHLVPTARDRPEPRIGILSARVGSISDNRLGGWHAYRASKAALNMLIKNYALEWSRNRLSHM